MTTITIKLPEELKNRLDFESKHRRISRSEVVRTVLENQLNTSVKRNKKTQPSLYDLTKDLCGCVKGGARDLASNPKHLEGFGQWKR